MLYQLYSENSKGKMNSCYNSRMSERRRNFLKCCEMFCDDTLEERAMNIICMKYPFLLTPGFIGIPPHLLHEICTRQYLYKTECNGEERHICYHTVSAHRGVCLPSSRRKDQSHPDSSQQLIK